ncbi:hypothetical protein [Prescottella equi]|uniref:hypothetical protein n=1 Tax=Rhodococcus hoagii TaxID=43767 RepID=UPI00198182A3|nr:hypothetical protein [Prescottella equi]MBM4711092.1 hypothetical protein [Prescottella equi]NKR72907.1 hypothetical protein [Prescottella equi]NKU16362.1 hypothetical protein [Prescottella equi]NKU16384.1 hypothetical protein [Prescottella equi]NKU16390.1 hypothetical protein [Prescottella equi]
MALRIDPSAGPTFELTLARPGADDLVVNLPLLHYIPRAVSEAVDAIALERTLKVQAHRDELNKKRKPIVDADPLTQYPTLVDAGVELIKALHPEAGAIVEALPIGYRQDIWKAWAEESKPADLEKSSASSDSSDETE